MGAGTLCTAYSSGLIDYNGNDGIYLNTTLENQAQFGFSMVLNSITGGISGVAAKTTFKELGGKVSQVSIRTVVSNLDQRGVYSTILYSRKKIVVTKDFSKPVGKYIIGELVENQNPSKNDYFKKFLKSCLEELSSNYLFNYLKWNYLGS